MAQESPSRGELIQSELVQDDPGFAELVGEFIGGLGARLQTLEQAARGSNFDQLRAAAHQLKGAAGGYGYPSLTITAARLEQHAATQALSECATSIEELKDLVSRVVVST